MDTLVISQILKGGVGVCQVKMPYKTRYALFSRLNAPNLPVMARDKYFIDCSPFRPLNAIFRALVRSCAFFFAVKCKNQSDGGFVRVGVCVCVHACIRVCVRVCMGARAKRSLILSRLSLPFSHTLFSFSLYSLFTLSKNIYYIYLLFIIIYLI